MHRLFIRLFFLGLTTPVWAQQANARFELLSNKDGLSSNTVNMAAEDERGFMWFGTRKNLTRYDGYSFQPVEVGQTFGLASDRAGMLYASTELNGELIRVSTTTKRATRLFPFQEGGAYSTFVDSFGNVWFSDRQGVYQYNPTTRKKRFYHLPQTTVLFHKGAFTEDADKNVWVFGMETGLFRYDRKADTLQCRFGLDCPRPDFNNRVTLLRGGFFDRQGLLWIAAERAGLLRYNPRTGDLKQFDLPNGQCFAVCPDTDAQGRPVIWIGCDQGIRLFWPDTETLQPFADVLPVPFTVMSICRSTRTGIVWFCTTEGLLRYNPQNQAIQTNRITRLVQTNRPNLINGFWSTGPIPPAKPSGWPWPTAGCCAGIGATIPPGSFGFRATGQPSKQPGSCRMRKTKFGWAAISGISGTMAKLTKPIKT